MKRNFFRLLLSAVLMMCCMGAWADGDWTILEQPTCSKYGTMQNPANTSELRLVPKLAHQFGDDGKCTVCGHPAPTKYNGIPASSLVTITEENYATYGLTATNKGCVMGWKVITTAEEFMKYMNSSFWIQFNAFLTEDIIMDNAVNLPEVYLDDYFIFDGTGHTISNVYRSGNSFVGLFGTNFGTIRNLGLISPRMVDVQWMGGCICGNNEGLIENCFVIDGHIEGTDSDLYGIAYQNNEGKIINCYAISNKGNVGWTKFGTIINSYSATTGSVPDDFYATALSGLNASKVNGITWHIGFHSNSYLVMMPSIGYHPATVTCTEDGLMEYWYCTECKKYFLEANHTQETTLAALSSAALGHDMKHFARAEATCAAKGHIEHYHCDRCLKNFKDENGTNEINVVIPINPDNHSLSLVNDKAHCEWCNNDFNNFVSIDNNPVLLNSENDSYSLDKLELKYGHSYFCTDEVSVNDFSYTFRYNPNVWNSWFVPFEITTADLGNKGFTAAYIAGVRQYEKDAEGNVITQVDVIKIKDGYLFAGTPYLIREESSATEPLIVTLKKTDAVISESSDVHPLSSATTTANYDFIGTYNEIAKEDVKSNYYILGSEGAFVHPSSPVYAMNWYMKIEEKGAAYGQYSSQAKAFVINVIGEEDQTTGIRTLYPAEKQVKEVYDLSGRRLNAPQKGQINIINGKKILVK